VIAAFDTYYFDNKAKTVCLTFGQAESIDPDNIYTEILENIEEYIPGEFYKRELPCILSLYKKLSVKPDLIIVDGFVYLDDENRLGLGGYLYKALEGKIPVIGVAKTNFATIINNKREVLRGESEKPLYITSIGINIDLAANIVQSMDGQYRIPTLLKKLDSLTKEID
jgi:deoxyribonuclease V